MSGEQGDDRRRLLELEGDIGRAQRGRRTAQNEAADLRGSSAGLTRAVGNSEISGVLRQADGLHQPEMWIGHAATLSRTRLDVNMEKCMAAQRAVNNLIEDLDAAAALHDRYAAAYNFEVQRLTPEFRTLQAELGYFNGIFR